MFVSPGLSGPLKVIGQFSRFDFSYDTRVKSCHQSLVSFDQSVVSQIKSFCWGLPVSFVHVEKKSFVSCW